MDDACQEQTLGTVRYTVPPLLAGTPQWNTPAGGNHDWVEFWDAGAWSFLGAAEPAPPNVTWCVHACRADACVNHLYALHSGLEACMYSSLGAAELAPPNVHWCIPACVKRCAIR